MTDAEACSGCSHGANKQAGGPVDKLKMGGRYGKAGGGCLQTKIYGRVQVCGSLIYMGVIQDGNEEVYWTGGR